MTAHFKKILLILLFAGTASVAGMTAYVFLVLSNGLPSLEQLENPKPELATKVLSSDGELLDQFFVKRRTYIRRDSIPQDFINALISTEDREFYHHWGIHVTRIFKAMVKNVIAFRVKEGASTITQQLARNLYLSQEMTLSRKIREAFTAIQIEKSYTKDEILELYANLVYFGRGAYGIQVAAQLYFNKQSPTELTTAECAYLVALLKAPEFYDAGKNYDKAVTRRNLVLNSMRDAGLLTAEQTEESKSEEIDLAEPEQTLQKKSLAPHFVEMVRQQLGKDPKLQGFDLYRDGLVIYTTLNAQMQQYANEAVQEHLKDFQQQFDKAWNWQENKTLLAECINRAIKGRQDYTSANQDKRQQIMKHLQKDKQFVDSVKKIATTIQVGFNVIDPGTGAIRAMVGSSLLGRKAQYTLNHAVQIHRQPGSAFKVFLYTAALLDGLTPETMIESGTYSYKMSDGTTWSLSSHEDDPLGKISLYTALKHSVNTVAARLVTEHTTPSHVVEIAHKMGIQSQLSPVPAIALGSEEVTPLEMTAAFAVFPNQGLYVEPFSISRIEDQYGNIIFDRKISPVITDALSPQIVKPMISMMRGVINGGTASSIRKWFPYDIAAGKTGTTNDFADAWFVGFTPQLSAGVWVGFDDMRVKFTGWYGQGGRAAAPIWGRFMAKVYKDKSLNFNPRMTFADSLGMVGDIVTPIDISDPPMEDALPKHNINQAKPTDEPTNVHSLLSNVQTNPTAQPDKKRTLPALVPQKNAIKPQTTAKELPKIR